MMKGGSGKVPQCFLHTRLTLRPFSIPLRTEYSGQTKPLQTVLHHTTMTLLCKNKGQGGPGMEHTAPGTHFPLLFSRDTEMGPRSLDNSYKKDVRVTVQTTKVTCGKGQSGLRVLFPLKASSSVPKECPPSVPQGPSVACSHGMEEAKLRPLTTWSMKMTQLETKRLCVIQSTPRSPRTQATSHCEQCQTAAAWLRKQCPGAGEGITCPAGIDSKESEQSWAMGRSSGGRLSVDERLLARASSCTNMIPAEMG